MSFLKKLKNFFAPKWDPLVCRPADIIDLFKQDIATDAPLEDLTVEIDGNPHHVGISSDYDHRKGFLTHIFFWTINAFGHLRVLPQKRVSTALCSRKWKRSLSCVKTSTAAIREILCCFRKGR